MSLALWAVNDGEKVSRDALDHRARAGNSVWDGKSVRLFGARGETVAFQVMVPAPDRPLTVSDVTVELGDPSIGAEILSEHYLNVVRPTPDGSSGGWYWHRAASPKACTGWIPDALVPLGARPDRGGLPLTVPAGTQQGLWVDLAIPREGAVPAGIRRGTITVKTREEGEASLPVELDVVDAVLSEDDPVTMLIYISEVERRHSGKDRAIRNAYREMARAHRLEPAERIGFEDLAGYAGELKKHKLFGISFYGAEDLVDGPEGWSKLDAYAAWLAKNAPAVRPFIYLTDEPRTPNQIAQVRSWGKKVKANPGSGGKLPVFVTTSPRPELEGAVDIFASMADRVELGRLAAERAAGRRWWFYNGMRPMSGAVTLDAPAVDLRVQPWICWVHGIEVWFLWESTYWRRRELKGGKKDQNVWADPATYFALPNALWGILWLLRLKRPLEANGDGILFYPGEDVVYPDQDRGVAGPISSIRMKNLRRGQQDVAWLALAVASGHEREAREVARGLIPRAFSDAKASEPVAWPEDGSAWDEARRKLVQLVTGR